MRSQLSQIERATFFLLLFFIPTQFGKHFWPSFTSVLGFRVDYLSPTFYFTDVLLIVIFLFWLYRLQYKNKISFGSLFSKTHKITSIVLFLFALSLIISTWQAAWPMLSLYATARLLACVFFGFYTAAFLVKKENIKMAGFFFTGGVFFQSMLAIAQYLNQGSIGGAFYLLGERTFSGSTPGIANAVIAGEVVLRPYATFSHPNVLAGYLLIGMLVISGTMLLVSRNQKRFFFAVLFLGTIALAFTLSRVAIFLWACFVLIWLYRRMVKAKRFLFVGFFVAVSILWRFLFDRFFGFNLQEEAVTTRIDLAVNAFAMFFSSPLVGVGLLHFLVYLPTYQATHSFWLLQPVHNIFLLIAAETGLIGLFVFAYLLAHAFLRRAKHTVDTFPFPQVALFFLLVIGLFDHYLLTIQQGRLLFAFVLGWCFAKEQD